MTTITITELGSYGHAWLDGDEICFGWDAAPVEHHVKEWLIAHAENAARRLVEDGLATIVATHPGTYGGVRWTVEVDVEQFAAYVAERNRILSALYFSSGRDTCHYCGQWATGTDFFGEPVCDSCSR